MLRVLWRPLIPSFCLVVLGQLADMVTFLVTATRLGLTDEVGPLHAWFGITSIPAITTEKSLGIFIIVGLLTMYAYVYEGDWNTAFRRLTPRRLNLLAAGIGVLGAVTNLYALR